MKSTITICLLFFAIPFALSQEKPNILFLLSDDQRPDTIGALGNDQISTPNLDELVRSGMSFSRATCSNPICVASRAEMLTGTHGWTNGMTARPGDRLREESVTWWGQSFLDAGYDTVYVGKWHTPGNVLTRGFARTEGLFKGGGGKYWKDISDWKGFPVTGYRGWIFQDPATGELFPDKGVGVTPEISSHFADAAIEALKTNASTGKPFFLTVNFTAPHDPLFLPPGVEEEYHAEDMVLPGNFSPWHEFDHGNFNGRDEALLAWPRTEESVKDLLRVYYAVIHDMDRQIGRILDVLDASGQIDNTYIIYSSDHGMSVGSHGLRGKQNMYEHTINVPLIIAGPGIEADSSSDAQVYLRELFPTTCELAGISVPEKVTAQSFAGVLLGKKKEHHDTIFGYFRDYQRMIRRDDGWKLIVYPHIGKQQLFQVRKDPDELNDLSGQPEYAEILQSLEAELDQWRRDSNDPLLTDSEPR